MQQPPSTPSTVATEPRAGAARGHTADAGDDSMSSCCSLLLGAAVPPRSLRAEAAWPCVRSAPSRQHTASSPSSPARVHFSASTPLPSVVTCHSLTHPPLLRLPCVRASLASRACCVLRAELPPRLPVTPCPPSSAAPDLLGPSLFPRPSRATYRLGPSFPLLLRCSWPSTAASCHTPPRLLLAGTARLGLSNRVH